MLFLRWYKLVEDEIQEYNIYDSLINNAISQTELLRCMHSYCFCDS